MRNIAPVEADWPDVTDPTFWDAVESQDELGLYELLADHPGDSAVDPGDNHGGADAELDDDGNVIWRRVAAPSSVGRAPSDIESD